MNPTYIPQDIALERVLYDFDLVSLLKIMIVNKQWERVICKILNDSKDFELGQGCNGDDLIWIPNAKSIRGFISHTNLIPSHEWTTTRIDLELDWRDFGSYYSDNINKGYTIDHGKIEDFLEILADIGILDVSIKCTIPMSKQYYSSYRDRIPSDHSIFFRYDFETGITEHNITFYRDNPNYFLQQSKRMVVKDIYMNELRRYMKDNLPSNPCICEFTVKMRDLFDISNRDDSITEIRLFSSSHLNDKSIILYLPEGYSVLENKYPDSKIPSTGDWVIYSNDPPYGYDGPKESYETRVKIIHYKPEKEEII